MTWVKYLGAAIRTARESRGLSQRTLAARVKQPITRAQLSTIECGHTGVSLERLAAIVDALEMTPDELVRKARLWAELETTPGEA